MPEDQIEDGLFSLACAEVAAHAVRGLVDLASYPGVTMFGSNRSRTPERPNVLAITARPDIACDVLKRLGHLKCHFGAQFLQGY